MRPLVIIPCGSKKLSVPAKAALLYQGCLFKAHLKWARSVVGDEDILILSAKHGFLKLSDYVFPYDQFMGKPGSISSDKLSDQAKHMQIESRFVYFTGGTTYKKAIFPVFKNLQFPLPTVGMGYLMQILKKNHGKLPKWGKT